MKTTYRRIAATIGVTLATGAGSTIASTTAAHADASASTLPSTWHIHDCASAPCVLPHAPVGFFPAVLDESLSTYLADPARCPDATDKAFLGDGKPPSSDGTVEPNQPLREGVCMTSSIVIHLRSVAVDQPVPSGWTFQGTSGGYSTYYLLTSH